MQSYHAAAFAALMTIASSEAALAQPMPTNDPAAMANVRESKEYSALLRSNPAFRKKREAIECGPINDPQLRQSCIASFEAYAAPAK
ncbi:MAG TPA: hypothetical protein VJX94_14815 [Stellaceae bacterium]|nr:hypothetical protein [Stellaceae bacterium]